MTSQIPRSMVLMWLEAHLISLRQPQHKVVSIRTAAARQTLLPSELYQLRLVLQVHPYPRVELQLPLYHHQSTKLRFVVSQQQLLIFVQQRTVVAAYTYILHHHIAVTVSPDRHLLVSQADQQNRKSFVLLLSINLNFLEDGVGSVRGIRKVKQQILAVVMREVRFIVLFAYFAFGLLVREEEGIIMFTFDGVIVNPVFQAFIVNVLHAAQAFAEAYKRIFLFIIRLKADSARPLALRAIPLRQLLGITRQPPRALRKTIHFESTHLLLSILLLLLHIHDLLQLQLHFADLNNVPD